MVNTDKLRGRMAEKRFTGTSLAEALGIARQTFYRKMDMRMFDSNEIEKMAAALDIRDVQDFMTIFFPGTVTSEDTFEGKSE